MKVVQLLFSAITGIALIMSVGCQKDSQDPPDNNDTTATITNLLPRKFTESASGDSIIFIYDNQNHLIGEQYYIKGSIDNKTVYTYQNGNPLKSEYYETFPGDVTEYFEFSTVSAGKIKRDHHYKNYDNGWLVWTTFYFFDDKGRLTKGEWEDGTVMQQLTYDEKNRVTALWYKEIVDLSYTYTYDNKRGIFSAVNHLFFFDAFEDFYAKNLGVNNLTEATESYVDNDGATKTVTSTLTYKYNAKDFPIEMHSNFDGEEATYLIEYQDAKKL